MTERTPDTPQDPAPWRLDRNWIELLQELRVAQTGVQILTAFLLTVPFSAGFDGLSSVQRGVYLAVLEGSIAAMVLLLAPVALHRQLFRRGERRWLVETGSRLARIGLVVLAATNVGAVWLVADVVTDSWVAWGIAVPTAVLALWLWWVLPWSLRRRRLRSASHDA